MSVTGKQTGTVKRVSKAQSCFCASFLIHLS